MPVPYKSTFFQRREYQDTDLDPVEIEFYDLTVKLQTRIYFEEGTGVIHISREILEMSRPDAKVEINEYMVACYGTTEYPEDMSGIVLRCEGEDAKVSIDVEKKV